MNVERELFKKSKVNINKLINYGFVKENNKYIYKKKFNNIDFTAIITIINNEVKGIIYDNITGDEYINHKIREQVGDFVSSIREEYKNILLDILNKCFDKNYFISDQANRITSQIKDKYNILPEFLWDKYPEFGIFRHKRSNKWFGIIMNINKSKLIKNNYEKIDVLNVKLDEKVKYYLKKKGIYEAYHMNKKNWVSIILDDTLPDNEIINLINISYESANIIGKWIVPANPKYYDIINAFNNTDTIIWKQSNNILKDDIIYIYVAAPYSSIMYKCIAIEVNIPYEYKDNNVSMNHVMKLKLLKKYNKGDLSQEKLNKLGIKTIRGPRSITPKLAQVLKKYDK